MSWTFPDNEININARITFGEAWNDVDFALEFCRYRGFATSLWRVAYRKPY
jgi:hypothetical protein